MCVCVCNCVWVRSVIKACLPFEEAKNSREIEIESGIVLAVDSVEIFQLVEIMGGDAHRFSFEPQTRLAALLKDQEGEKKRDLVTALMTHKK